MVIVNVKVKGSNEWVRESFLNPQHYIKWRDLHASRIVAIKPVRKARVRVYA